MAKNIINITEENLTEWMHSVGYFLPRNSVELMRFERLHATVQHSLEIDHVNPMNIINGTWTPKRVIVIDDFFNQEIYEMSMAARNHSEIPNDILDKIKKKHSGDGNSKGTEGTN